MEEALALLEWILQGNQTPRNGVRGRSDGRVVMVEGPFERLYLLDEACAARALVLVHTVFPAEEDPFLRACPGALADGEEDFEAVRYLLFTGAVRAEPLSRIRTLDLSALALRLSNQMFSIVAHDAAPTLVSTILPALVDLDLSQHRDEGHDRAVDLVVNVLSGLPVPRLRLRSLLLSDEDWTRVAALPELERIEDLDLSGSRLPADPRALFDRMPRLRRLRMRRMPEPVRPEVVPVGLTWLDLGQASGEGGAPWAGTSG